MSTDLDLYKVIYNLVRQIPSGKVSTYKSIAAALGDTIAIRAVKQVLNRNFVPERVPYFRVINSNGTIDSKEHERKTKRQLLEKEGIELKGDQILNFRDLLFTKFKTDYPLELLKKQQIELSSKIILKDMLEDIERIGGVDASYKGRKGIGACVVLDRNLDVLERKLSRKKVAFPYIPTYFSYHELPVVQPAIHKLHTPFDLLFVDGHGLLHPRLGFASHLGIEEGIPTIGVAKTLLCGEISKEPKTVGAKEKIMYRNKHVGYSVKTCKQANPVYVTPGYKISLDTAVRLALEFSKFKLPEPIRKAHKICSKILK